MSERITARPDGHWLVFDDGRQITGCHCGFRADVDSDCGWGDSVVDHIWDAARTAPTLKLLALPYADHSDCRQEWK